MSSPNAFAMGTAVLEPPVHRRASAWLVPLFASTLFLSAFLLFLVQPMVAKMVLPILGGAPMVWNACMVFFQLTLLAGYAYAHAGTKWLTARGQVAVHAVLLLMPFVVLPVLIQRDTVSPPAGNPALWLLVLLAFTIGMPFFVLSTSASVLQQWFSRTDHAAARDPYFLYVASNLGSFLALAAYPLAVEPILSVQAQSRLWTLGYASFVALAAICAWATWRQSRDHAVNVTAPAGSIPVARPAAEPGVPAGQKIRWVALAFVPSSLMLAVTTYLSTDIAAVPLMWVMPLALYLLTFIVAFSAKAQPVRRAAGVLLPLLVVPMVLLMSTDSRAVLGVVFPLHLLTFTAAALVCHGELARTRPSASHLTGFYLWMSFGGMLGGFFNALAAPYLFDGISEYPIAIVIACLLLPAADQARRARRAAFLDVAVPVAVGGVTAVLVMWLTTAGARVGVVNAALGLPAIVAFSQRRRPVRFGLSVGSMLLAAAVFAHPAEPLLHAERTFFGVYRVSDRDGRYRTLAHGTTLHGMQALTGADRDEPLTYFHRTGPFGQAFAALPRATSGEQVAVIGLGVGTLAAYAGPNQNWTFYEIDPAVERIARTPSYFTFLDRCGARCRVVLGDARLSLEREPEGQFDLLVLDAFSSDAIPMHLLTREALGLYVSRLKPGGAILFHISNRHLSLDPVVAGIAASHGLIAVLQADAQHRTTAWPQGRTESRWVALARRPEDLGALAHDPRWAPLRPSADTPLWTDDFSNILSVLTRQ